MYKKLSEDYFKVQRCTSYVLFHPNFCSDAGGGVEVENLVGDGDEKNLPQGAFSIELCTVHDLQ